GVEAGGVVLRRDGAVLGKEVEAAHAVDELVPRSFFHRRPAVVGTLREADVVGAMLGVADDARVILRAAAVVHQLELLDPQHLAAQPARQPEEGARTDAAETENDGFVVVRLHEGGRLMRSSLRNTPSPTWACPCASARDALRREACPAPSPLP